MSTQKQRVRIYLETQDQVCVTSVPLDLGYTLRNRIHELRDDGLAIHGERCTKHAHRGPILAYSLVGQQAMAI
jgi:hypothetical protein